ncbi:MAG: NAD(P)-dependent oxidoreductase [Alphaproteobacteria bacterium]|nr:NAD(P)-dependent oxidoreductase [Alphaproteobacteria bacterium]
MKKAIITGANGFVGSAVTKELVNRGVEVLALDMKGHDGNLPENQACSFAEFDLAHPFEIKERAASFGADIFYHFAWAGSAGKARTNAGLQLDNAKWTVDCLQLAKEIGCKRFVNAGSIMEKETVEAVFSEGNRPGLPYIYGSGKLVAHTICKAVAADIGMDIVWAMITNAYGVGEKSARLINATIRKCIHHISPQFTSGVQNYDFVYIDDVARAFFLIGEKGKPFCEYLIGSSRARPLKDFLLEMREAIAPDLDFVFGEVPYTGVLQPLDDFDCSLTERDTGFRAEVGFGEGCRRTMEWMISDGEE